MNRPLVGCCFSFVLGIWLGESLSFGYSLFFVLLGLVGWGLSLLLYPMRKWVYFFVFILSVGLGAMRFNYVEEQNQSRLTPLVTHQEMVRLQGEVVSQPIIDGNRVKLELMIQGIQKQGQLVPVNERILLYINCSKKEEMTRTKGLKRYMTLVAPVRMEQPPLPRNPGGFNYRAYLHRQQIHWMGKVEGMQRVYVQFPKFVHPLVWLDELRKHWGAKLEELFPSPVSGFMRGMLLGEREQVDSGWETMYSTLGIVHLLSISGLHVSALIAALYLLLKYCGVTREGAVYVVLLVLPLYVLLTGAGAPVVRCGIMAGLACWAFLSRRVKDTLSFLAAAFLLQVIWNPYQIEDPGFQLSYLVTAGLIIAVPSVSEKLPFNWKGLRLGVAVALVAQAVSFPIVINHFHEFSILSGLANLIIVPVVSFVVLPLAVIALVTSYLWDRLGEWVADVTQVIVGWIQIVIEGMALHTWAHFSWAPPSWLWLVLYGLAISYLWMVWVGEPYQAQRHRLIAGCSVILLVGYAALVPLWERKGVTITFLDVGQGDSTIIETREGKVIMIDGGGTPSFQREKWQQRRQVFEVGKSVVIPFLKYKGIQRIDTLILTHGDADHIGGIQAVVERFPVGRVIRNSHPAKSVLEKKLMERINELGIPVVIGQKGLRGTIEPGLQWYFMHPNTIPSSREGTNNDSVVFLLDAYGFRILMTGDVEEEGENVMLSMSSLPPVDLLKVAHHGSKTSTGERWLAQVSPKDAVISVGTNNRYGHPSPTVLDRLHTRHVRVWRTDEQGAITVTIQPKDVHFYTMLK